MNTIEQDSKIILVGSRKSQLALIQTNYVIDELKAPGRTFNIVTMTTVGDNILDKALSKIGEKSLFTKELEIALEKEEVDFVVHSLKDIPTTLPQGMVIGAVLRRENPCDAVILHSKHQNCTLATLPAGSVIGTSSLRRIAQLSHCYPHLKFQSVRGNLNTRIRKLDEDSIYDALILAVAGLQRMDLTNRISHILQPDECMYAVGQGALGVECRENDPVIINLISQLTDRDTLLCCVAERSFMKTLEGGCSVPVAVQSSIEGSELKLRGGVFSLDGSKYITHSVKCNISISPDDHNLKEFSVNKMTFCGIIAPHLSDKIMKTAEALGSKLANKLLEDGASEILKEARRQNEAS